MMYGLKKASNGFCQRCTGKKKDPLLDTPERILTVDKPMFVVQSRASCAIAVHHAHGKTQQ
ncbi:MAG: hypothetical protein E7323_00615 [Clostridiales bacterium]|nr:hypothetical protein [Clostridiales bacterium]